MPTTYADEVHPTDGTRSVALPGGGVPFVKGHGTENDFVLLPDLDGTRYGAALDPELVRRLCDRRRGIGADGVLRVVRAAAIPAGADQAAIAEWFLDYVNADGSVGEMCGNGIRVFLRYLVAAGLLAGPTPGAGRDPVAAPAAGSPSSAGPLDPAGPGVPVATRAGLKRVWHDGAGGFAVDMGVPAFPGLEPRPVVRAGTVTAAATPVDMGNPHAVAFVTDLSAVGPLTDPPVVTPDGAFPAGVNVEFAVRAGERAVAMRVFERGVGETRSCGTGACAVAVVAAGLDGASRPVSYTVRVPGGSLQVTWRADGHVLLAGPAELTASGQVPARVR